MLKLFTYLLAEGVATARGLFPDLGQTCTGLPALTANSCAGSECKACADLCPTSAIAVSGEGESTDVALDLGACIGCGLCIDACPTGTIVRNRSVKTAATRRHDLVLRTAPGQST